MVDGLLDADGKPRTAFPRTDFFPLNGIGLEAVPRHTRWASTGNTDRNFSYTMELVRKFRMEPNLSYPNTKDPQAKNIKYQSTAGAGK